MTGEMEEQVTWSDLGFSFGKMYPVHSAATMGETSRPCWRKLSTSQSLPFLYLDLRGNGQRQEPLTVMGGLSLGELMMLNTGECPNAAVESRLSQILEDNPQEKYYLSAKACRGILRRAERRGKDLPKLLKQVLLMQSESGGGCDGGGKGALVQTEKSGTMGTGNDQTIFTPTPINLMVATRCKALGRGTGFGVGEPGDPANTISAAHSHGVFATAIPINDKATRWQGGGESRNHDGSGNGLGIGKEGDPYAECGGNKPTVLCLNDQGGNVMGVSHDVSSTLRAQEHGHQPSILDMSHACDIIRDCGEMVLSLQARMGTGGNQVPLTYQMQGFGDYRAGEVASSCKHRDFKDGTDLAITNMAVRRLTPMECERLQGFPDGWTDIGEWVDEEGRTHKQADSPRYKALGNSIALPFWHWMFCRMAEHLPGKATLGSLFDGIGGFPLCWESIHGKGTARWASEIEKFPMAVTKLRFPEEA